MSHRPPPPMVACIMLVNGRPDMIQRSLRSFLAQTYPHKRLLIWDTTPNPIGLPDAVCPLVRVAREEGSGLSVGALRNHANEQAFICWPLSTLFAHWDSDDWSHPLRIEEQVAFLQTCGKDAVGYRDMLFWDTTKTDHCKRITAGVPFLAGTENRSEAWLYESHHPSKFLGSSMLYKRKAWEASPFHPDEPNEDTIWWGKNQARCAATSTLTLSQPQAQFGDRHVALEPRMVCAIHGANTSEAYGPAKRVPAHWRRLPNWDAYCREAMKL